MKVTLIWPGIREYGGWNSLGRHPECVYTNHGLSMIAAVLKREGHRVDLIDLRECSGWDDVQRKIVQAKADIYGISMNTLDYHEAVRCGEIIKEYTKGISVVGGPHPTICPNEVRDTKAFHYVWVGEAEKSLSSMITHMGFYVWGSIITGQQPDLNSLPYEDRTIWNLEKIMRTWHPFFKQPVFSVISGRGCNYNCSFCKPGENLIFGLPVRIRSVDHLMGEIKELRDRYGMRELIIDDDCFTQYPEYVFEFCDAYDGMNIPFIIQGRANEIVLHHDMFKRLKEVGLRMCLVGFESGNQRILNLLRKGTTVKQNYEAARILHELGIEVWANYMLGMPTETKEEALDTIKMIREIHPEHPSPAFFTPIPGTDLYTYCKENDLILSEDPATLGTRSPLVGKIKGVDYAWLSQHIIW